MTLKRLGDVKEGTPVKVTLSAIVAGRGTYNTNHLGTYIRAHGLSILLSQDTEVEILPRDPEVGDRITFADAEGVRRAGQVRAIDADTVWVRCEYSSVHPYVRYFTTKKDKVIVIT